MSSATDRAGSNAMPRWLTRVRIGTSALRLPLIAPIRPIMTLLLPILVMTSANLGSGTYWSSAESGGAMLGLIFA